MRIHDKNPLAKEVVPQHFFQSKYNSFKRQLISGDFKRLHKSDSDSNVYYHECFLCGLPHLTVLMKRVPGNQCKLIPHVEGGPNFYKLDRQFPLLKLAPHQVPGCRLIKSGVAMAFFDEELNSPASDNNKKTKKARRKDCEPRGREQQRQVHYW